MKDKVFLLLMVSLCVAALIGCEGKTGPAGPAGPAGDSVLLAYGDIFFYTEGPTVSVISSGPNGIAVSGTAADVQYCTVTVDGTFPSTAGVLLVSLSTGGSTTLTDRMISGKINSWSEEQIEFVVSIWDVSAAAFVAENFSFALLGD